MTSLITRRTALVAAAGLATTTALRTPLAWGAEKPIVIGCSMPQTGGLAAIGKANLLIMKIWAEEVNAKGGILGRPVQFVYYDDQSNPANIPGIYTKLLDVDKVDLIITNGTNLTAPAMPVAMERGQMVLAMFALTVNEKFHYDRYFQTMPYGPLGKEAISNGFFEAAMGMNPKPKTVALVGADAEFSKAAVEGAKGTDSETLAKFMHANTFKTIVGDIKFGEDGEWDKPQMLTVQFRGVKGKGYEQFTDPAREVILDPPAYKSGDLHYPMGG